MSMRTTVGVFLAKAVAAILLGNVLFRAAAALPFDMPYRVDMATRWLLRTLGRQDLANPDDMEVIVGLALAAIATAIGAIIVRGACALVGRLSARPSHA